jgi:hypothetical protein
MMTSLHHFIFQYSNVPTFHRSGFHRSMLSLHFRFINVAPAPVFARLKGLDNGVAACVKVLPRVPIR